MSFFRVLIWIVILGWIIPGYLSADINVVGADGVNLNLISPATRVISLVPSVTEILFKIGAGKNLIAVSEGADFPKEAELLPRVSGVRTVNLAAVLSLQPDLIIAWDEGTSPLEIQAMRNLGLKVLVIKDSELADIPVLIKLLGQVTRQEKLANQQAEKFQKVLNFYQTQQKKNQPSPKVKIFIQIGSPPLFTAGKNSIQSEIVELCGGQNIFDDIPRAASEVSERAVIERNPDWIIELKPFDQNFWENWPEISAVKQHQELAIDPEIFASNGPRVLGAVEMICKAIKKQK